MRKKRRKRRQLARILAYLMLEVGASFGVPMRPDEIEALMNATNRVEVVEVLLQDDPPEP